MTVDSLRLVIYITMAMVTMMTVAVIPLIVWLVRLHSTAQAAVSRSRSMASSMKAAWQALEQLEQTVLLMKQKTAVFSDILTPEKLRQQAIEEASFRTGAKKDLEHLCERLVELRQDVRAFIHGNSSPDNGPQKRPR